MPTTQCTDVDRLIPSYLDGELAQSELHSFEHHVSECEECDSDLRSERDFLTRIRSALATPPASDTLRARLGRALDEEDAEEAKQTRRARTTWVLPGAATVAAAAALLVFVHDVAKSPQNQNHDGDALHAGLPMSDIDRSAGEFLQMPVRAPSVNASGASFRSWQPLNRRTHNAALFIWDVPVNGERYRLEIQTLDARNLDLRGAERRVVRGATVYIASAMGLNAVSFSDENGVGYVFSSLMHSDDLVELVVGSVLRR